MDTRGVLLSLVVATGCRDLIGIDEPQVVDLTCRFRELDLCHLSLAPTLLVTAPMLLDTGSSPMCEVISFDDVETCVVYADRIDIAAPLRAVGPRPLILASNTSIQVTSLLDVSSSRAENLRGAGHDAAACEEATDTGAQGGGGAGGSFGGTGGNGGSGQQVPGTIARAAIDPPGPRGGCPGDDATGTPNVEIHGSSGGCLWVLAKERITITSTGDLRANGMGGEGSFFGGGGGGSGGYIVLDGASVEVSGFVTASGGGGGEGGGNRGTGIVAGNRGADGNPAGAAAGGTGSTDFGGDGERGSFFGIGGVAGKDAFEPNSYGGGGGGGAGIVIVDATQPPMITGFIAPPRR